MGKAVEHRADHRRDGQPDEGPASHWACFLLLAYEIGIKKTGDWECRQARVVIPRQDGLALDAAWRQLLYGAPEKLRM